MFEGGHQPRVPWLPQKHHQAIMDEEQMKIYYQEINYSFKCFCEMIKLYLTKGTFTIITINFLSFVQKM